MTRYERPVSRSAFLARFFARLSCGLFLIALAFHRFGPLSTPAFLGFCAAATAMALIALCLAIVGLIRLWQVAAKGGRAAFSALLYAALPLVFAGIFAFAFFATPALHDISTDPAAPPAWIVVPPGAFVPTSATLASDAAAQKAAYPDLSGRRYDGALDRVLAGVRAVADSSGVVLDPDGEAGADAPSPGDDALGGAAEVSGAGDPVQDSPPEALPETGPIPAIRPSLVPDDMLAPKTPRAVRVQGVWRTPVVGLRYDLVFRLREEAETTFVDLRIAPRFGQRDLGIGADFAAQILRALDAELLGIAGG